MTHYALRLRECSFAIADDALFRPESFPGARDPARRVMVAPRIAVQQPTPWIRRFWKPSMSGATSVADTIIWAVNDSSTPSPAR